ncbi:unnamed protein product [Nesidiocoris tenuis]|uniref:Uncharacterized protein n=1 Tax=Nesidiocoris tenuis TaxID=355587 RepID=A0A6H5H2G6_9HEMI|nr:unnamed protein product [Nesidiocoris tenuis]
MHYLHESPLWIFFMHASSCLSCIPNIPTPCFFITHLDHASSSRIFFMDLLHAPSSSIVMMRHLYGSSSPYFLIVHLQHSIFIMPPHLSSPSSFLHALSCIYGSSSCIFIKHLHTASSSCYATSFLFHLPWSHFPLLNLLLNFLIGSQKGYALPNGK